MNPLSPIPIQDYSNQMPQVVRVACTHREDGECFTDSYHYKNSNAIENGSIIYSGWLTKRGHVWKSWKRRFFVLRVRCDLGTGQDHGWLQYYKNNRFGKLKGEVSFSDVKPKVRLLDIQKSGRPHCFEIVKGFYSLVCQGRDEQDAFAWISYLEQVINSCDVESLRSTSCQCNRAIRSRSLGEPGSTGIASEVRKLLESAAFVEGRKCISFVKSFDARASNALTEIRQFLYFLTKEIFDCHSERLIPLLQTSNSSSVEKENELKRLITRHVEESVFLPLHDQIYNIVRRSISLDDESSLYRNIQWLQGKNHSYFGIPIERISWSNWNVPVVSFSQVDRCSLPSDKREAICLSVDEIRKIFEVEHQKGLEALTSDDLIPIFAFILVNSNVENLLTLKGLLFGLGTYNEDHIECDIDEIELFSASINWILNISIPPVLKDIFKEQTVVILDGNWSEGMVLEEESNFRYGAMVKSITTVGQGIFKGAVQRGNVLVSVSGENVVLWTFEDILEKLGCTSPPVRLAFISGYQYARVLESNQVFWNEALIRACIRGKLRDIQRLLVHGAEVNCVDEKGCTPLHIAVSNHHLNVVSYLLQHKANIKQKDNMGRTPLHMVSNPYSSFDANISEKDIVRIIEKLVSIGVMIDEEDYLGYSSLMLLSHVGCVEGVQTLLDVGASLNSRSWKFGYTAIAVSAREGHHKIVQLLCDYRCDLDCPSLFGETPLHLAAGKAFCKSCKILLGCGAGINRKCNAGRTPLMMVVSRGRALHSTLVDDSLHVDISSSIETIDCLINNGADIHAVCSTFRQPIHYAALYGTVEIVELILRRGGDPESLDIDFNTPLDLVKGRLQNKAGSVSQRNCWKKIQLLLESSNNTIHKIEVFAVNNQSSLACPETLEYGIQGGICRNANEMLKKIVSDKTFRRSDLECLLLVKSPELDFEGIFPLLKSKVPERNGSRIVFYVLNGWIEALKQRTVASIPLYKSIAKVAIALIGDALMDNLITEWLQHTTLIRCIRAYQAGKLVEFARPSVNEDYAYLVSLLGEDTCYQNIRFSCNEKLSRRLTIAGVLPAVTETQKLNDLTHSISRQRRESVLNRVARLWQLDFPSNVVAQQVTLVQHYRLQRIPVLELTSDKKDAFTTPYYDRARQFHNHCSLWVMCQVLGREDVNDRSKILSFYIDVAKELLNPLQNYDGFMAVMSALNDSALFRLKLTWATLTESSLALWNSLNSLTQNGGRPMHKRMKNAFPPCIPYIGLTLQSIIAFQEFPELIESNQLNISKIRKIGNILRSFRQHQKIPYLLRPNKRIIDNINSPLPYSTKQKCFERSLVIEPRIGHSY